MLNTHRGTVVRATLKFENGVVDEINPLKQNIGGILFDKNSAEKILTLKSVSSFKGESWCLLETDGSIHGKSKEYVKNGKIKALTVFVIYPDGTVWEGKIGGTLKNVSLLAWSDGIIHALSDSSEILKFYKASWQETPTSIIVKGKTLEINCSRIEHSCGKQCEKIE